MRNDSFFPRAPLALQKTLGPDRGLSNKQSGSPDPEAAPGEGGPGVAAAPTEVAWPAGASGAEPVGSLLRFSSGLRRLFRVRPRKLGRGCERGGGGPSRRVSENRAALDCSADARQRAWGHARPGWKPPQVRSEEGTGEPEPPGP